jgi:LysR family transcriptional regulator, benzoate and cis,cis-muconate-responsive activator of ben and cat genes
MRDDRARARSRNGSEEEHSHCRTRRVPLVLYAKHPNAQFSRFVESLYRNAGFARHVAYQANEIQTAIALVAVGLGVSFVSESVARHDRSDVIYRPLQGAGASRTTTLTARFRSDDPALHLQAFLKTLVPHDAITGSFASTL